MHRCGNGWRFFMNLRFEKHFRSISLLGVGVGIVWNDLKSPDADITKKSYPVRNPVINEEFHVQTNHKLTKRELRFLEFASVEYNDVVYMTPMDFIDSIIHSRSRERIYRQVLEEKDVKNMLSKVPRFANNSCHMMRDLDRNGIISYAEYSFLLTLLTKSERDFRIAFTLFDTDDNDEISKNEFLLMISLVPLLRSNRFAVDEQRQCRIDVPDVHYLIKNLGVRLLGSSDPIIFQRDDDEVRNQDTTLLMHLFGSNNHRSASFEQLKTFRKNLQTELMVIEFYEFSRGAHRITPVDFARLLLRYSAVRHDQYVAYIDRVHRRNSPNEMGITIKHFESFNYFLNNLDDFTAILRLYGVAGIPIAQEEFIRAARLSTGYKLEEEVVELIYRIFDANNDNNLSHAEFIAVMIDRLHRGIKSHFVMGTNIGWLPFKQCVMNEVILIENPF